MMATLLLAACGDSETTTSAQGGGSQGEGGAGMCDRDQDGLLSLECGGADCCDVDPDVPREEFAEVNSVCGHYDVNCDGTVEREVTTIAPECSLLDASGCFLSGGGTEDPQGWRDNPPGCGTMADWQRHCRESGMGSGCFPHYEPRLVRCR